MGEGDRVFWKDGGCESHSQEKGAIRELGVLGFQEPLLMALGRPVLACL
jgi:hypothetical protein